MVRLTVTVLDFVNNDVCMLNVDGVQHSEVVHAAYQTLQDVIATVPSTPVSSSDKQPTSLISPL